MSPRGEEEVEGTGGLGARSGERFGCMGAGDVEAVDECIGGGGAGFGAAAERTAMAVEIGAAGTRLGGSTATTALTEVGPCTDEASAAAVAAIGAAGPLAEPLVM